MVFSNTMLRSSILAVCASLLVSNFAQGREAPIRVGIYQDEPEVFRDENNQPAGFWPELLEEIAETEGWTLEYIPCQWESCLVALENSVLDLMLNIAYSPERERRFDLNNEVVISSWSVIYTRQENVVNSIVDLDAKRLGVLEDSIQHQALVQRARQFDVKPIFIELVNYETLLEQLESGKIDAAVLNKFVGGFAESQYAIAQTNILVAPTQVYFGAPVGENADVLRGIDQHLRRLKATPDSAYYQLLETWLTPKPPLSWHEVRQIALIPAVILVGMLAIAVSVWNRSLRAEIERRTRTENLLQKNEEQLRLALELTHICLWDWDIQRDRVEWNDNHFHLPGLAADAVEPTYEQWSQAIHPDDRERVTRAVKKAAETQTAYLEEYRIIHSDGSVHWILGHGSGVADETGNVNRMLGVMLDITTRKQTKEALRQSEVVQQQILQAIPDLLIWMRADGTYEGIAGGGNLTKLAPENNVSGLNQYEILPPALADTRKQAVAEVLRTGQVQRYEQTVTLEDRVQYEEVRVVPIEADKVLVIIRNISDRKQAEIALADSEQRYRIVTENMTDLVCLHRPDGQFAYITPSCESLLGYTRDELIGRSPYALFHEDDVIQIRLAHDEILSGNSVSITYRIRHKSGQYIWLETLAKSILDASGQVTHLQTTSREVSDRVLIEQQLRYDALHDALTNLPNRLLLIERLELAIKRSRRQSGFYFAILFVDVDRFKVINDSLGHSIGDELLITLAQKFCNFVRETDLVARIGGDEFVILLEDIEVPGAAETIAERILEDLRLPLIIKEQEIFVSASIGIVSQPIKYQKAEDLIRNADIAMYRAKGDGRAGYAVFNPKMHAQVMERMHLENDLRRAIDAQEFVLVYQPIVSLKTLRIIGFEALIRWQHPTMGLLTPNRFIDIVEETDLIIPLGEWVLLTACQQVAMWQAHNPQMKDLRLTVNLSVKQLKSAVLIPQLNKVLTQTHIPPPCLTLEITESLLVENIGETSFLLNQVQSMGFTISIDDFGTGYSSLSYLHQLPVDSLKIDRTFVSPDEPTLRNQTIAESIVGLSNLLELKTIAEGIETPQQLQWLQTLHCEYGQGYLFSKPVSASEAQRLLEEENAFAQILA